MLTKSNKKIQTISKQRIAYTIISTLFVAVVVYKSLFYPINFESSSYIYSSETDNSNKPLVLLETVPKIFEASITKIDKNIEANMNFTSTKDLKKIKGLEINFYKNKLNLQVGGESVYEKEIAGFNKIGIKYEAVDNSLTINENNKILDQIQLDSNMIPSFTGYHLNSSNILFESNLETKNWKRNFGNDRHVLLIILLILIFIFVYLNDFKIRKPKLIKISLGDSIVAISLIASGFLSPPGFDDGELLSLFRNYETFGYAASFSNAYPLGQWWFAINSYWFSYVDQIFLFRLPNLLTYLASWFVLDRLIVKHFVKGIKYQRINLFNSFVFLIFSIAWAGTLRYDPPVILFLSIALFCVYRYITKKDIFYLIIIGFLISLSISTSISGFVILPLGIFLAKYIIQNFTKKNIFIMYNGIILNLGFLTWIFFFNTNLQTWIMDLKATFGVGDHSTFFLNELERYQWIFNIWGSAARLSVVSTIFIITLALINLFKSKTNFEEKEFILLTIVLYLGLLLTPSKFGWHFQVYLPLTLVLSTYVLKDINQYKYNLKKLSPILALTFIPVVSGINIFGFTVTETYRTNGPVNYFEKYLNMDHLSTSTKTLVVYIVLLTIIYGVFKLLEINRINSFLISIFMIIFFLISPSVVYPILDAKDAADWNFTKQSVYGISSRAESCGLENSTSVITEITQLPKNSNLTDVFKQLDTSRSEISDPLIREYVTRPQIFNYLIPNKTDKVVFWLSGVTTPQDGSVLISLFEGLNEISKASLEVNAQVLGDDWQIFEINTSLATSMRIEFLQRDAQIINWRIIHPGEPQYLKLYDSFKSPTHSIGSYWANYLFFPCATLGIKNNGVKLVPEYQFGSIVSMRNESIYSAESELIPVGCIEMLNIKAKSQNCFYRVVYEGDGIWKEKIFQKTY
jgi:hypothetical protein